MIRYTQGNMLNNQDVDCIINPVNCKGVMGKGLALQIAERYPGVLPPYKKACDNQSLTPGRIQFVRVNRRTGARFNPNADNKNDLLWILNLPTKDDWRQNSRIEWIDEALQKVPLALVERNIKSIAVPKLGSGLGGLEWSDVRDVIEKNLFGLNDVDVVVYGEPSERINNIPSEKSKETFESADLFDGTFDLGPGREKPSTSNHDISVGEVLNFSKIKTIPENAVYIGRNPKLWEMGGGEGLPWLGNPFIVGKDGSRDDVLKKYESYIDNKLKDPAFRQRFIETLSGKDQICHCAPEGCHGHINQKKLRELNKELYQDNANQAKTPTSQNRASNSKIIESFTSDEYRFLSNMYPAKVKWGDSITPERVWPNVEIPYVLSKTIDPNERSAGMRLLEQHQGKDADSLGKIFKKWGGKNTGNITLRKDWDQVRLPIMRELVKSKFFDNPELGAKLKATKNSHIQEGNYWGDVFFGVSLKDIPSRNIKAGDGENHLGNILMNIREELPESYRNVTLDSKPQTAVEPDFIPRRQERDYKVFAGIGSRETPESVCKTMSDIAKRLCQDGWLVRSGGAGGADQAFERGADDVQGKKEIFLPWANFENNKSKFTGPTKQAMALGRRFHPKFDDLKQGAQKMHARNCHQMLGEKLDDLTDIVICYTDGGKVKGGTGQALRIAEEFKVPVVNLGHSVYKDKDVNFLSEHIKNIVAGKERPLNEMGKSKTQGSFNLNKASDALKGVKKNTYVDELF